MIKKFLKLYDKGVFEWNWNDLIDIVQKLTIWKTEEVHVNAWNKLGCYSIYGGENVHDTQGFQFQPGRVLI